LLFEAPHPLAPIRIYLTTQEIQIEKLWRCVLS